MLFEQLYLNRLIFGCLSALTVELAEFCRVRMKLTRDINIDALCRRGILFLKRTIRRILLCTYCW